MAKCAHPAPTGNVNPSKSLAGSAEVFSNPFPGTQILPYPSLAVPLSFQIPFPGCPNPPQAIPGSTQVLPNPYPRVNDLPPPPPPCESLPARGMWPSAEDCYCAAAAAIVGPAEGVAALETTCLLGPTAYLHIALLPIVPLPLQCMY